MLAGLSKKETFRTPPDFWATAGANVVVSMRLAVIAKIRKAVIAN
jgi:hypothetical protein